MRRKLGLVTALAAVAVALFAGTANAAVISGVKVDVGAMSVTVSGYTACSMNEVNVEDVNTNGGVYDYWGGLFDAGPFSYTATGLTPGTRYRVVVYTICVEGYWGFVQEFVAGSTPPEPQGPDRYIYCAAAGNTDPAGNPLGAGQTLNLEFGQPDQDKHYAGATLGFWVEGVGLTCQLTPAQAALAAASTTKVNHTGAANTQEGAQVYTFVPAA